MLRCLTDEELALPWMMFAESATTYMWYLNPLTSYSITPPCLIKYIHWPSRFSRTAMHQIITITPVTRLSDILVSSQQIVFGWKVYGMRRISNYTWARSGPKLRIILNLEVYLRSLALHVQLKPYSTILCYHYIHFSPVNNVVLMLGDL